MVNAWHANYKDIKIAIKEIGYSESYIKNALKSLGYENFPKTGLDDIGQRKLIERVVDIQTSEARLMLKNKYKKETRGLETKVKENLQEPDIQYKERMSTYIRGAGIGFAMGVLGISGLYLLKDSLNNTTSLIPTLLGIASFIGATYGPTMGVLCSGGVIGLKLKEIVENRYRK
jgi:hypothetical protein